MAHATAHEVLQALDALDYPASKEDVVRHAESTGAPENVLRAVRALPLADYASKDEIVRSLDLDPAPDRSAGERAEAGRDRDKPLVAEHSRDTRATTGS
jgi:hypothetical protein